MADRKQIGGEQGFQESEAQAEAREKELAKGKKKSATEAEKTLSATDLLSKTKGLQAQVEGLLDISDAPVAETKAGDVSAQISGSVNQQEAENKQIESTLTELMNQLGQQGEGTEQKGILKKIRKLITRREDIREEQSSKQELLTQTLEQFGVTPESFEKRQNLQGQLVEYQKEIQGLEAQRDQAVLGAEQQLLGRPEPILRGEKAIIDRQYNSRISAKAAQAGIVEMKYQFETQNFQDAVNMSNMVVEAALYDQKQQVQDIDWAMSQYKDIYGILDREEEQEWNRTYQVAKDELDQQRNELNQKLQLMTSAAQEGIDLGWDMDYIKSKSLEELTSEASPKIATEKELEGTGLREEIVGGFRVLKDAGGNVVSVREVSAEEAGAETWDLDYIRADLRSDMNALRAQNPNITNDQLYQTLSDAITMNKSIKNKDDAYKVLNEMFGRGTKTEPETAPEETQFKSENYTSAGDNLLWTPDGRLIEENKMTEDIERHREKAYIITGEHVEPRGFWTRLFGEE